MPVDLQITGADDLERVSKALEDTGNKELRKDLLRGLREIGKPAIADVRASARRSLPQRGGLADLIAGSKFATRSRVSGSQVGTRIEGKSKHDLKALEAGVLRHPVFGRKAWAKQSVAPGWFSRPFEARGPQLRRGMQNVLDDIAAKIERST